jgi:hypothetical protein
VGENNGENGTDKYKLQKTGKKFLIIAKKENL